MPQHAKECFFYGQVEIVEIDAVNGAQLSVTNDRVAVTETAIAGFQAAGLDFVNVNSSAATGAKPAATASNVTRAIWSLSR